MCSVTAGQLVIK